MITMNDLKAGMVIQLDNKVYQVLAKEFIRNAQRRPVMATKLKDIASGKVKKYTFQQSDKIKEADIAKTKAQFLYQDENNFYFMDTETYDQFFLPKEIIGTRAKFLMENTDVFIINFEEKPIDIVIPIKMDFKVVFAPPAIKGNTVQTGTKEVEIETGLKIKAPLFIKEGDIIRINTDDGNYVERVPGNAK